MKKKFIATTLFALAILLTGCGNKSKLASDFEIPPHPAKEKAKQTYKKQLEAGEKSEVLADVDDSASKKSLQEEKNVVLPVEPAADAEKGSETHTEKRTSDEVLSEDSDDQSNDLGEAFDKDDKSGKIEVREPVTEIDNYPYALGQTGFTSADALNMTTWIFFAIEDDSDEGLDAFLDSRAKPSTILFFHDSRADYMENGQYKAVDMPVECVDGKLEFSYDEKNGRHTFTIESADDVDGLYGIEYRTDPDGNAVRKNVIYEALLGEGNFIYGNINNKTFEFASGAGGWMTSITVSCDGTFTGTYVDSDLGGSGEDYSATVYQCEFSGMFGDATVVDTSTLKADVVWFRAKKKAGEEYIIGDTKYVNTEAYGIAKGDTFEFYMPNKNWSELSEDFKMWTSYHFYGKNDDETLGEYALYNESLGCGWAEAPDL